MTSTLVVHLAAQAGATVIATAKGEDASALVRDLGAREIVAHTSAIADTVRATHSDGVDVIVHLAGDPASMLPALKDGGRFVSTLVISPEQLRIDNGTLVPVFAVPTERTLDSLAVAHADGSLRIKADHVYPLKTVSDPTPYSAMLSAASLAWPLVSPHTRVPYVWRAQCAGVDLASHDAVVPRFRIEPTIARGTLFERWRSCAPDHGGVGLALRALAPAIWTRRRSNA